MVLTRRTLLAGTAVTTARASTKKATALALIGDRYHNSDYIRTALGKTLVKDGGLSIDFTDELTALNEANLRGYRLLIILRDGMIWPSGYADQRSNAAYLMANSPKIVSDPPLAPTKADPVGWITAEQGRAVRRFAENGGSILFYHNVTYIARYNEDFRHALGAVTQGHPPIRAFKVKVTNSDHPIMRGVKDFVVTDEQHYMIYDKDPKHVIMRSVNEDGLTHKNEGKDLGTSCEAGWAYDYGKGRVAYLAPGHLISSLWNPEFEKVQRNAVKWLLRQAS